MPKIVKYNEKDANICKQLSGLGITHEQICSVIGITKPTLYKYYSEELLQGKAGANAKVLENLFRIATGDGREAVTACIFWAKTQCGFREVQHVEVATDKEQTDEFKKLIKQIREAKSTTEKNSKLIN
tara:strand:- start:2894 stop:3277 length:384 start_codon:yes stop_codon:yes gene_type:complete